MTDPRSLISDPRPLSPGPRSPIIIGRMLNGLRRSLEKKQNEVQNG
jgi:hypothetical protein